MDKIKLYVAPIVALVLLLLWYFVVQPRLADEKPLDDKTDKQKR
jgi:hypothetical protein